MKKEEKSDSELVCVLCGEPWMPEFKNRCECGGFCSWGYERGGEMLSWGIYPFEDESSIL